MVSLNLIQVKKNTVSVWSGVPFARSTLNSLDRTVKRQQTTAMGSYKATGHH